MMYRNYLAAWLCLWATAGFAQENGQWKTFQLPDSFESRSWAATAWTGSEFLYWGGSSTDYRREDWKKVKAKGRYLPSNGFYFSDGWKINPKTGKFTPMPDSGLPLLVEGYTSVWTGRYLFVRGGTHSLMKLYDYQTNVWKKVNRQGAPLDRRINTTQVWTGKEVLIWGGTNYAQTVKYNDGFLYNPTTNVWRKTSASILSKRGSASSFWTGREVIIWGGSDRKQRSNGAAYNPATGKWRKIADNPFDKGYFFYTKLWTGKECLFLSRRTFGYNPATNQWKEYSMHYNSKMTANFNTWTGRYLFSMTGDSQSKVWDYATMTAKTLKKQPATMTYIDACVWLGDRLLVITNTRYSKGRMVYVYQPW